MQILYVHKKGWIMQIGMYVQVENQSEVARLKQQLDAECEAARRALYSFAEAGKHAYITKKMENVGRVHDELIERVGEKEATELLVRAMEAQ
jgi:hypothetical protein